jgi:hypothetical protein
LRNDHTFPSYRTDRFRVRVPGVPGGDTARGPTTAANDSALEARAPAFHLVAPAGYRIDASGFHGSLSVAGGLARSGRGLGVYVGNYPGLLLPQRRDKPKVSTVAGTVAGQRVTWACWQEPPRRVVCETTSGLIPETSESVRTILHLWVKAASKKEAVTYRRLASTQIVPFR